MPEGTLYDEENEKALIKLNNFREQQLDEDGKVLSARTGGSNPLEGEEGGDSVFNPDKIPTKIMITRPKIPESGL